MLDFLKHLFRREPPPLDLETPEDVSAASEVAFLRKVAAIRSLLERLHHKDTPGAMKDSLSKRIRAHQMALHNAELPVPRTLEDCRQILKKHGLAGGGS